MAINPLIRPLGIASSVIASCQGFAWSVLALLAIIIYSGAWNPEIENLSSLSLWLFELYLTDMHPELIMKGSTTIIFTSIYLALSLIWMIISLCKLWITFRKKWQYAKGTLIAWSICTGIISVLDIIAISLFAVDYETLINKNNVDPNTTPYNAVAAGGVAMTIAARGFVLLIANIVFTIMFAIWSFNLKDKDQDPHREFINAYDQQPQWMSNGNLNGNAFGRSFSNPGYESDSPQRPSSYDRNRYATSPSENIARIGRNNARPSQNYINQQQRGPYIPEPDYSPTSLRKHPKSVLKTKSHY